MNKITKKLSILSVALTVAALAVSGCGSSKFESATADYAGEDSYNGNVGIAQSYMAASTDSATATSEDYDYEVDYDEGENDSDDDSNETTDLDSMTLLEEKLVYYCDMDIETLDYDTTIASIKEAIKKYDGVIQSEDESDSSYNWYYENYEKTSGTMSNYMEIRIPSANYESFIKELDGVGKIISKSTSVDNISQKYYDTTTRIEALQIQEKNLLEMLDKCETIADMITVEERLSNVQYELNNLQTTKRYMDIDVAYSYVDLNIKEVMEYHYTQVPTKQNTFLDRLKNTLVNTGVGFLNFLENLLFLIINLAPYIIILLIILFIFRKRIKKFFTSRRTKTKTPVENPPKDPPTI
jgi:hypothetical protein